MDAIQDEIDSDLIEDNYLFTQDDIGTICYPIFDELRKRDKLIDVHIQVDGKDIPAHKIILASTIPYFHAMFTLDMVESSKSTVEIQNEIDGTAFELLIDYCYSGQLKITLFNVESLLVGASFLQLSKVSNACCDFLKKHLHVSNVLGVQAFADAFGFADLVESAKKFIHKKFQEVIDCEEYLRLSVNQVIEIISSDDLNVASEDKVFEAVMLWIKHEEDSRKQHLPSLLKLVRLPLLTPQYLADYVTAEELVRNSLACRDLVDEAKDYHLMPERRSLLQNFRTRQRSCPMLKGLIYAVGGLTKNGESLSTVEVFNSEKNIWYKAEAMTMMRSRVGVAVMNNKLYAIGGYDGQERLNTVEVFDPMTKLWTKVISMNCRRRYVIY